jgi:hypothetical protein
MHRGARATIAAFFAGQKHHLRQRMAAPQREQIVIAWSYGGELLEHSSLPLVSALPHRAAWAEILRTLKPVAAFSVRSGGEPVALHFRY